MVALWNIGIAGETEMEKAIVFASIRGNKEGSRDHIVDLLRDHTYTLTSGDREALASYLAGDFRNPVGRRPKTRQTELEKAIGASPVQRAAAEVRAELDRMKAAGHSTYGWRRKLASQMAEENGVSEAMVLNCLNRGGV